MPKSSSETLPRVLLHFPIIHSELDLGSLSEAVRRAALRQMGLTAWKRKMDLIDAFWARIEKSVDGLTLEFAKTRLYQDGMPVCGKEAEIVGDLAKGGSRNYIILLRLMQKGARIMGTESPQLLVEEYELSKQQFRAGKRGGLLQRQAPPRDSGPPLLEKRDRFIAERIHQTLEPGETGILFLGMLHSLELWLSRDIQLRYPTDS